MRIDEYKYRFIDQPEGWVGPKNHPDMPILTNLRLDPFERTGWSSNGTGSGAVQYWDWFKFEFWRFVFVQQEIGKEIQTFLAYPPMQKGASFNLDALKAEMGKKMAEAQRQPRALAIEPNGVPGGRPSGRPLPSLSYVNPGVESHGVNPMMLMGQTLCLQTSKREKPSSISSGANKVIE